MTRPGLSHASAIRNSEGHGVKEADSVRDGRRHSIASAVEQNCCQERNILYLPGPIQPSLATGGNGALEMCQADWRTEFLLISTFIYLYLNEHNQLEATILSSADVEQWFSTLTTQWNHLGRLKYSYLGPAPQRFLLVSGMCLKHQHFLKLPGYTG